MLVHIADETKADQAAWAQRYLSWRRGSRLGLFDARPRFPPGFVFLFVFCFFGGGLGGGPGGPLKKIVSRQVSWFRVASGSNTDGPVASSVFLSSMLPSFFWKASNIRGYRSKEAYPLDFEPLRLGVYPFFTPWWQGLVRLVAWRFEPQGLLI